MLILNISDLIYDYKLCKYLQRSLMQRKIPNVMAINNF